MLLLLFDVVYSLGIIHFYFLEFGPIVVHTIFTLQSKCRGEYTDNEGDDDYDDDGKRQLPTAANARWKTVYC